MTHGPISRQPFLFNWFGKMKKVGHLLFKKTTTQFYTGFVGFFSVISKNLDFI